MIHHWMTDEKEMRFHDLSCMLFRIVPASREQAVSNTLKPPEAMKCLNYLEFVFRCAPMIECLCIVLIPPSFRPVFTMPTVCSSGWWAWDLALQRKTMEDLDCKSKRTGHVKNALQMANHDCPFSE